MDFERKNLGLNENDSLFKNPSVKMEIVKRERREMQMIIEFILSGYV